MCLFVWCCVGQHVISKPDVVDVAVEEGSDEFVLLASDGLWDVFSPQVHPDSVLYSRVTVLIKCWSDNLACYVFRGRCRRR